MMVAPSAWTREALLLLVKDARCNCAIEDVYDMFLQSQSGERP